MQERGEKDGKAETEEQRIPDAVCRIGKAAQNMDIVAPYHYAADGNRYISFILPYLRVEQLGEDRGLCGSGVCCMPNTCRVYLRTCGRPGKTGRASSKSFREFMPNSLNTSSKVEL